MGKGKKPKLKELGINILFLLIVMVVLLGVFEVFLRVSYGAWSNFNSEMWRYSTEIKDVSDNPDISHKHMPNKESILYGVNVKTNAQGFRDKDYPIRKPEDKTRILVLGDSVTLGWGVNQSDIYTEVLEEMLDDTEVINAAVGNYNTEMEAAVLPQYLELEPDIVLIGFFPNDGEKTLKVKTGPSYFFKSTFYLYPFFWDRYVKLKFAFNKGGYTSKIHTFYSEEYGGKGRIESAFSKLKFLSDENDFDVIIVIIPQLFKEFDEYDSKYIHEFVMDLCLEMEFTCVDTLGAFSEYSIEDVIISREDAHPNALGHRLIAEEIAEVLEVG